MGEQSITQLRARWQEEISISFAAWEGPFFQEACRQTRQDVRMLAGEGGCLAAPAQAQRLAGGGEREANLGHPLWRGDLSAAVPRRGGITFFWMKC